MSYMKNHLMNLMVTEANMTNPMIDHARNQAEWEAERERQLREDVERLWWEVTNSIRGYTDAVVKLDKFRDEIKANLADRAIKRGENPF